MQFQYILILTGDEWTWSEEDYAGNLGSPKELLEKIKKDCVLLPVVGDRSRKQKARQINSRRKYRNTIFGAELGEDSSSDEDEVSWQDIKVKAIPLQEFEENVIGTVEDELKLLVRKFKEAFQYRFKEDKTLTIAKEVFHKLDWFQTESPPREGVAESSNPQTTPLPPDSDSEDEQEQNAETKNRKEAETKLMLLIESLPEPLKSDYFNAEEFNCVVRGFLHFIRFVKSKNESGTLEDHYSEFCKKTRNIANLELFKSLFERIEIKGYSECFCEAIGEIIKEIQRVQEFELLNSLKLSTGE